MLQMNLRLTLALTFALAWISAGVAFAGSCCDTSGLQDELKAADTAPVPKDATAEHGNAEVHEYKLIDTAGLKQVIDNADDVVILDARSGKYDDGRRIPGAKQLSDKSSPEEIAALLPDKDAKVIAYCTSTKCPASARLAKHLYNLGYSNVTKYPDGIEGWSAAGLPVEQTSN
jgi:rhodanese-related sulfurtransferase